MAKYRDVDAAKLNLQRWITECLIDDDKESADRFRDCIDLLGPLDATNVVLVGIKLFQQILGICDGVSESENEL